MKASEKKLVKCMVCGEVFDSALEKCPVCGAGSDKLVPIEEKKASFKYDTNEVFLILGGGPAAYNAAKAIRERNSTAGITIITDERFLPYNRPMLTKSLITDFSDNQFAIEQADWFIKNNIFIAYETKVVSIDTAKREVICENSAFRYNKLIYAIGARCFLPPVKGIDKPHAVTIRNLADVGKVKSLLPKTKNVVCIGGGVMGLEGAWDLTKGGFSVTLIETSARLLHKQLDEQASAILLDLVEKAGVNVITEASAVEITDSHVVLADGKRLPADLVILSAGMRPNIEIAEAAGLDVGGLVNTDLHMRTSDKLIYACGDCVAVNGARQSFWAQAVETGRVAGANAAGDADVVYSPLGAALYISAFNTSIFALGTNGTDPDKEFRVVDLETDNDQAYERYYFLNDRLAGVILIGDTSRMVELTDAYNRQLTFDEIMNL